MNTSPDSDEDDVPDASELLDFELIAKSQPEKGRGLWLWVVLIIVLAGGGWAGWMFMQDQESESANAGGVPLILSPSFALKEKPADPGGMKVPDRDKGVYDRMNGGDGTSSANGGVERLLPPPETPIEPPKAKPVPLQVPVEAVVQQAPQVPKAVTPPPAPPVPKLSVAPAPAPVAPAAPAAVKTTAPAGQGYMVQLSAVRTEQAAMNEWARLAVKHPDVLGALYPVIQRADLGDKGIFYRVRGGWLATRAEAKAVCNELKKRNVGCLIAKP